MSAWKAFVAQGKRPPYHDPKALTEDAKSELQKHVLALLAASAHVLSQEPTLVALDVTFDRLELAFPDRAANYSEIIKRQRDFWLPRDCRDWHQSQELHWRKVAKKRHQLSKELDEEADRITAWIDNANPAPQFHTSELLPTNRQDAYPARWYAKNTDVTAEQLRGAKRRGTLTAVKGNGTHPFYPINEVRKLWPDRMRDRIVTKA